MKYFFITLVTGWVLFSCAPRSRESANSLLDVDGLIDRQLEQLYNRKPLLTKQAQVDASRSDSSWTPGAAVWKNELEIFRALGMLNKQIYAADYIKASLDDPQSNLQIHQYANPGSPLRWLRVYYLEKPDRIRQIEGEVEEDTPLFSAHRRLSLWFEEHNGQPLVSRYEIVGFQKSAMRDTVHFRVQGVVGW